MCRSPGGASLNIPLVIAVELAEIGGPLANLPPNCVGSAPMMTSASWEVGVNVVSLLASGPLHAVARNTAASALAALKQAFVLFIMGGTTWSRDVFELTWS